MARSRYDTSMGGTDKNFPTTKWTQLLDLSEKETILSELCANYWKPLYCYLRGLGFENEKAKDLVQGFLTEKIINKELIFQANRTKGKLRTFLLTAIRNYAINVHRKDKGLSDADFITSASNKSNEPEDAYDRAWADDLLQQVLKQLKIECVKRGKTIHWQLFQQWLLNPNVNQNKPKMTDLCEKYGIENTAKAYHMIENIKRRFRTILKDYLRDLVDSDGDIDSEIIDFINIFQKDAARS